jgi:hypothetical protein
MLSSLGVYAAEALPSSLFSPPIAHLGTSVTDTTPSLPTVATRKRALSYSLAPGLASNSNFLPGSIDSLLQSGPRSRGSSPARAPGPLPRTSSRRLPMTAARPEPNSASRNLISPICVTAFCSPENYSMNLDLASCLPVKRTDNQNSNAEGETARQHRILCLSVLRIRSL